MRSPADGAGHDAPIRSSWRHRPVEHGIEVIPADADVPGADTVRGEQSAPDPCADRVGVPASESRGGGDVEVVGHGELLPRSPARTRQRLVRIYQLRTAFASAGPQEAFDLRRGACHESRVLTASVAHRASLRTGVRFESHDSILRCEPRGSHRIRRVGDGEGPGASRASWGRFRRDQHGSRVRRRSASELQADEAARRALPPAALGVETMQALGAVRRRVCHWVEVVHPASVPRCPIRPRELSTGCR